MTPLLVVVVAVFVCAIFFLLVLVASLLAAFAFWCAPALEGTILALTASDIARMLRQMPTYPAWWHRHGVPPPKPIFGILALNPVAKQPEYMFAINPMHQPVFTTNRDQALRVNCADRFLIQKLLRMAEDDGLNMFLVLAEGQAGRNAIPGEAGRRPRVGQSLKSRTIPQLEALRPHAISGGSRPSPALVARVRQAR
jgi:hypothetical protein